MKDIFENIFMHLAGECRTLRREQNLNMFILNTILSEEKIRIFPYVGYIWIYMPIIIFLGVVKPAKLRK